MAPKGCKRASQESAADVNKKPKLNSMMLGVVDALRQATDLPQDCLAMLEAGVPGSLGPPANERHPLQMSMVRWIGETIESVEARLRQAVGDEDAKVATARLAFEEAEKTVSSANGNLEAKDSVVATTRSANDEAVQAVKSAKAGLTDAQVAQKMGDASLAEAGKLIEEYEGALKDHVGYLKEDSGFDASGAKMHTNQVMRIAKKLGIDDSLLTALPSACATMPSQRGTFDKIIISELETSFQNKVTDLTLMINTGTEATANRAAAVTANEQMVQAAEDAQKDAEAALAAAQAAQGEAAAGLREAANGSKAKAAEQAAAEELKKKAEWVLESFIGYNVLCFSSLRDKVSKPEGATSQTLASSASPAAATSTAPPAAISASPPAGNEAL